MSSIFFDLNYVVAKPDIQKVFESEKPDDKLLVENLYKNLDDEAKSHLDKIIKRNKRVIDFCRFLCRYPNAEEIYTKEDFELYKKTIEFKKEIEVYDDYYKWKNFILPVNFFEPSVFLFEHGLNSLKYGKRNNYRCRSKYR